MSKQLIAAELTSLTLILCVPAFPAALFRSANTAILPPPSSIVFWAASGFL
jgi:hypothetical protein